MSSDMEFGGRERVENGSLLIEGVPEIPGRITERLRQCQNARPAALRGWLPGGDGIVIATRFAQTDQLHVVREPGGARRQITFFDEPVGGAAVCPDSAANALIFTRDIGGSEFHQLFLMDLATGEHRMLTDGQSRNGGAVWSNRGDRFAFFTTRRNGRDHDVHVADRATPDQSTPLVEKEGTWQVMDWSPDDTLLLLRRYVSINECCLYTADVRTGSLTELDSCEDAVARSDARFTRDGSGIFFASDRYGELRILYRCDLATGRTGAVTGHIPWEIGGIAISPDRRRLAFSSNEDGVFKLRIFDAESLEELPAPDLPMGIILGLSFSPDGTRLGMTLNGPRTVGDVYVLDLASNELCRWTFSETGGLTADDLVAPELIRYPTFDQVDGSPRMIPSFYYRPRGKGPFPVLISIHGGPEGQSLARFSPSIAHYVGGLGIAVLLPNVRGSTGYGKSYLLLDNGYLREDSVKDIGALLDWIAACPELDETRVAVSGASYGGYMVLACMAHYNDRLRAGVELVGISNFVTFLENTQAYRRDQRRTEYGDERDPRMREFLTRISPTNNVDRITKPLLIGQGLNDPRVPATESEQMVAAIRRNGGTVAYVLANDEGHGFRKKANRDYFEAATTLFLEHYLIGGGSA